MELAFSGWSGILVLLAYGILMLAIGTITFFKNRGLHQNIDEYYLGGRGLGFMVLFFTFYATQYSGNTIVGYIPEAYRTGFNYLISVPFFIGIIVAYLMFAPRLYSLAKKYKLVTPVDWLHKRFNSKAVSILGAFLMLYALANYLLEQFIAIGHGVTGLTGGTIPYQVAVVFFIVVMLIYGWLGGMRSVAYTDTMQGFALLFGVFMLLIGSIMYFGGLPSAADYMQTYSPEKLGVPDGPGVVNWFSLLVLVGIGAAVYPHAIQRIFSAKNEKTLKKSFSSMAWMPFITAGIVFLIGIIGITAFPGLETSESEQLVGKIASAIASQNLIFYWSMVLLFGGVIAAIVSTADSVLLTFSSIITKDLYGKFINPDASDKKKILVGKLTGVVAVGLILLVAWFPPSTLYQIFVLKFELLIQVAPAIIIGLYWQSLKSSAVFAGMLVGTVTAVAMTFAGVAPLGIFSGLWGLLVNLVVCVGGSVLSSVTTYEHDHAKDVIGL